MEGTDFMGLVSSLGPSGVLGWYCWYVTSTTLPRLMAEFREETRLVREEHKMDREAERQQHAEQVERFATAIEAMVAHCKSRAAGP